MMKRIPCSLFASALVAFSYSSSAGAELLVYEGFNYANGASLIGTKPGDGTVGLNTDEAYSSANPGDFTVQSESLSFGGLATSGGAASFTNVASSSVSAVKLSLDSSSFSGTLWSSYLIKLDEQGEGAANGVGTRVADGNSTDNERFQTFADSRNSSNAVAALYGSGNTAQNSGVNLQLGETYLLISRFTNVGTALSETTTGVATVWALTEGEFGALMDADDREAYLENSAINGTGVTATATSTAVTGGTFDFKTGNFVQFVSVAARGTYDELRFGSTLADVTPVPEPASVAMILGLAAGGLAWRRRRASR